MSVSVSLKARKEIEVQTQEAINGAAAGKGVNYPELDAEGVWGPYQTGCEEGRSCYEISLEDQKFGKIIEVFVEQEGLIGHWKAETLAIDSLYVDGDPVEEWTDVSDQGNDLTLSTDAPGVFKANRINGYPAVCAVYQEPSVTHFTTRAVKADIATTDFVFYVVCCVAKDSWNCFCSVDTSGDGEMSTSWEPALVAIGQLYGQHARLNKNGDTCREHPLEGDEDYPDWPVNKWCVVAFRACADLTKTRLLINGIEPATRWGFLGPSWDFEAATGRRYAFSNEEFFFNLGWNYPTGTPDEGTVMLQIAECRAVMCGHSDERMLSTSRKLAEKYGIEHA